MDEECRCETVARLDDAEEDELEEDDISGDDKCEGCAAETDLLDRVLALATAFGEEKESDETAAVVRFDGKHKCCASELELENEFRSLSASSSSLLSLMFTRGGMNSELDEEH